MEIQILDDAWYLDEKNYKGLKPTQRTGSIYGVVPPSKDALKPAGEWNTFRIVAKGRQITVELNGTKVVDANLDDHKDKAKEHSGISRQGARRVAEPRRAGRVSEHLRQAAVAGEQRSNGSWGPSRPSARARDRKQLQPG